MFQVSQLHGFNRRRRASGPIIGFGSVEYYSNESSFNSLPGSVGNLYVFSDYYQDVSGTDFGNYPTCFGEDGADFTAIGTLLSVSANHYHRFSRLLSSTANEIGQRYNNSYGETFMNKILARFTIAGGTAGTPVSSNQQATTGNPTAQTITPSTPYGIGFACYMASATVSPRTSAVTATGELSDNNRHYMKYFIYDSIIGAAPASFTVDMADEGTNLLRSCWIPVT